MKSWNLSFIVLLHCVVLIASAPPTTKNSEDGSKDSAEVAIPDNMNIADYYYSIFGKHLDYDYREPILTFDEPVQNELTEEDSDDEIGSDVHNRVKRFVFVPANFYNATRRWSQQMRRLRMERRRLRLERRRQWQQNRINYLNRRSEALRLQASRLNVQQQRTQQLQARVQPQSIHKTSTSPTTTSSVSTSKPSSDTDVLITDASNPIPVKQVPLPTKN